MNIKIEMQSNCSQNVVKLQSKCTQNMYSQNAIKMQSKFSHFMETEKFSVLFSKLNYNLTPFRTSKHKMFGRIYLNFKVISVKMVFSIG